MNMPLEKVRDDARAQVARPYFDHLFTHFALNGNFQWYDGSHEITKAACRSDNLPLSMVSRKHISSKNATKRDGADRPTDRPPTDRPDAPPITRFPIPADAVAIARVGLSQLAQHLQSDELLPIKFTKLVNFNC